MSVRKENRVTNVGPHHLSTLTTTLTPPGNWSRGMVIAIGRDMAMVSEAPSENKILEQRSTLLLAELVVLVGHATFLCSTPAKPPCATRRRAANAEPGRRHGNCLFNSIRDWPFSNECLE